MTRSTQTMFTAAGAVLCVAFVFVTRGTHEFDPLFAAAACGAFMGVGLHGIIFGRMALAGRWGSSTVTWHGLFARSTGVVFLALAFGAASVL